MRKIFGEWMNLYTGEVYDNLFHAIRTIIGDMVYFKTCRTIKMLRIAPYNQ